MVKKFVYLVNSIPFAGKIAINPLAHQLWSATTIKSRTASFVQLRALLMLYVLAHTVQAVMGFVSINPDNFILLNLIFVVYAVLNTAVTIAQLHLMYRAIKLTFRRLPKYSRSYKGMSKSLESICILVTLLGQIAFLVAYALTQH